MFNDEENEDEHIQNSIILDGDALSINPNFEQNKRYAKIAKRILRNNFFVFFMYTLTVYILIVDYFKIFFFDKSVDAYFDVATIVTLTFFVFELILMILSNPSYM